VLFVDSSNGVTCCHIQSTAESRLSDIPFYPKCLVRPEKADRTSHNSKGLNSIETALDYVEQQREATAADLLLFVGWRDLVQGKGRRLRSKSHY
jgi:hypothetical protein